MEVQADEALRVLGWAEFVAHPSRLHPLFAVNSKGKLLYDKRKVINLTQSTSVGGVEVTVLKDNIVLHTPTPDQLKAIQELFLCRLLLLRITIYHTEISSKYSVETVSIVEDDFAVLLNFKHPSVRPQINYGFQSSFDRLLAGRRFCLEVDMTTLMLDWYMEFRDAITSCDDMHSVKSRRTRLSITNHTLYNHGLDCGPKWILFLCLCWVMVVPCYRIHRKLTCADIRVKLKCDVTTATCSQSNEATRVYVQHGGLKNYDAI